MYSIKIYKAKQPNDIFFEDDEATFADLLSVVEEHVTFEQRAVIADLLPGASYSTVSASDVNAVLYVIHLPDSNKIDWESLYADFVRHSSKRPKDIGANFWEDLFWHDRGGREVFYKIDGFGVPMRREYEKLKEVKPTKYDVTVWDEKLDRNVLRIVGAEEEGLEAIMRTMTEASLSERTEFLNKVRTKHNTSWTGTADSEDKHYSVGVIRKES